MSAEQGHDLEACRVVLIRGMLERGADVTVSTEPHLVETGYDQGAWTCPHGTRFYMEPTTAQRIQWVKDGVR